jgi:hypothetical protein
MMDTARLSAIICRQNPFNTASGGAVKTPSNQAIAVSLNQEARAGGNGILQPATASRGVTSPAMFIGGGSSTSRTHDCQNLELLELGFLSFTWFWAEAIWNSPDGVFHLFPNPKLAVMRRYPAPEAPLLLTSSYTRCGFLVSQP